MSSGVKRDKTQPLVRIDAQDKAILDELSARTGESAPRLLHRAMIFLRQKIVCDEINAAYEAMRRNPELWQHELAEREILDGPTSEIID